ncbi:hypothetical protein J6590_101614 [Homalodisca vitripennis]|nr:hypothetical protein J6590_101614 [Homalodisca vitripennis]
MRKDLESDCDMFNARAVQEQWSETFIDSIRRCNIDVINSPLSHSRENITDLLETLKKPKHCRLGSLCDNPDLKNKVKYSFCNKYFKENFAYCSGRPQLDVCSTCERLSPNLKDKGLNDNSKRNVPAEKMVHLRRAKKFYKAKEEASQNKDDNTVALAFDYDMQNLPLPHIPVGGFLHKAALDDVLSFKTWWPKVSKEISNSDETSGRNIPRENKQPFKVSKYKLFLYNKDTPGKVVVSEFIAKNCQPSGTTNRESLTFGEENRGWYERSENSYSDSELRGEVKTKNVKFALNYLT